MKTLTRKTRSDKFLLTLHTTGQYCKKINGKMVLRWAAGGFLATEKHFQRITENTIRDGIVLKDLSAIDPNLTGCTVQ